MEKKNVEHLSRFPHLSYLGGALLGFVQEDL